MLVGEKKLLPRAPYETMYGRFGLGHDSPSTLRNMESSTTVYRYRSIDLHID